MKRIALLASLVFVLSGAAQAASPSKASLKGTYFLQFTKAQSISWGKQLSVKCFGVTYNQFVGGSSVNTQITYGTVTFSGAGTLNVVLTDSADLDQDASNDSVSLSCTSNPKQPITSNSGNPVFAAGTQDTVTGTYTVASNSTGVLTPADPSTNGKGIEMKLGAFNGDNIATVVLMMQLKTNGDGENSSGVAILAP
ncbi:MAG: hypothetical protein WBE76_23110 [Terracidiphilus sp.]